ncbi:MAG: hypothetical protein FWG40_08400 [Peptococcaceae bacterium]|nr:hypothetical protein [Peptococcaceae bacterium]
MSDVKGNQAAVDEEFSGREEEIFAVIKGILAEVIGEDMVEIIGIRRESMFLKDLMIDSIQITAFAEKVTKVYGDRVDFVGWLSKKPLRQLTSITVGEVSAFIASEIGK